VTTRSLEVRVGRLWRRRRDGKAFIPAKRVAGGWLDRSGVKRTADELRDKYVHVVIDDAAPTDLHAVR
jgi:hypothetical protein